MRKDVLKALDDENEIVGAWFRLQKGATIRIAADKLSKIFDRKYTDGKLLRWRRGAEHMPEKVRRFMRLEILVALLGRVTGARVAKLLEQEWEQDERT